MTGWAVRVLRRPAHCHEKDMSRSYLFFVLIGNAFTTSKNMVKYMMYVYKYIVLEESDE